MNPRKWRDVRANARELGLWRGGIPATPEEAETFHVVMKKAQEEEDEEKLSELLAQAARQGRVSVEPAAAVTNADEPTDEPKNKGGRPSKEGERLDLMKSLLTKYNGNEGPARAEFVTIVSRESMGRDGKKGLVGRKSAGAVWYALYRKLGDRRPTGRKGLET